MRDRALEHGEQGLDQGPFAIGFNFPFYGGTQTQFYVSSNGYMTLGSTTSSLSNQCPLPNSTAPNNTIAMLWDDLNFGTTPRAYTHFDGARFIVSWVDVPHYGTGGPYTFQVILHPTDLSEASQVAFAHALRLATHNKAFLSLLHVCADDTKPVPWGDYPSVRETLARWGLLASGARRSDVARQLGLRVEKVVGYESNVTDAIVGFLRERAVDMIVIATEGRTGLPRWIKPSIAEPVAQRANVPTLFVPHGARSCVSLDDGHVTLDNVLIPVAWNPQPDAAIARGVRALDAFGSENRISVVGLNGLG